MTNLRGPLKDFSLNGIIKYVKFYKTENFYHKYNIQLQNTNSIFYKSKMKIFRKGELKILNN